jgi:hypothetical protein
VTFVPLCRGCTPPSTYSVSFLFLSALRRYAIRQSRAPPSFKGIARRRKSFWVLLRTHSLPWLFPLKLLLISHMHIFSEGFSPPYLFFAVVLNYLRTLTIKIVVDEPGRPPWLDCLPIIGPQRQGDFQTRPCWPGQSSSRTSSTSRPHANSPSDGPPHQSYTLNQASSDWTKAATLEFRRFANCLNHFWAICNFYCTRDN